MNSVTVLEGGHSVPTRLSKYHYLRIMQDDNTFIIETLQAKYQMTKSKLLCYALGNIFNN